MYQPCLSWFEGYFTCESEALDFIPITASVQGGCTVAVVKQIYLVAKSRISVTSAVLLFLKDVISLGNPSETNHVPILSVLCVVSWGHLRCSHVALLKLPCPTALHPNQAAHLPVHVHIGNYCPSPRHHLDSLGLSGLTGQGEIKQGKGISRLYWGKTWLANIT